MGLWVAAYVALPRESLSRLGLPVLVVFFIIILLLYLAHGKLWISRRCIPSRHLVEPTILLKFSAACPKVCNTNICIAIFLKNMGALSYNHRTTTPHHMCVVCFGILESFVPRRYLNIHMYVQKCMQMIRPACWPQQSCGIVASPVLLLAESTYISFCHNQLGILLWHSRSQTKAKDAATGRGIPGTGAGC